MKVVKIQGGLGNQLFCLAFAYAVARRTGEKVGLEIGGFRSDQYERSFELYDLAAGLDSFRFERTPWLANRYVGWAVRKARLPWLMTDAAAPPADPRALARRIDRSVLFDGYWQHEAWLEGLPEFADAVRRFVGERASGVGRFDVVVHVRTYKEERVPSRRGAPGEAYYRAALDRIRRAGVEPRSIALISDDPDLAMERIGDAFAPTDVLKGQSHYTDMATMFEARALILSNSSFSWWGGVCSNAEPAVYPARGELFHYPRPASRFLVL